MRAEAFIPFILVERVIVLAVKILIAAVGIVSPTGPMRYYCFDMPSVI
jgi:hypothetical protein